MRTEHRSDVFIVGTDESGAWPRVVDHDGRVWVSYDARRDAAKELPPAEYDAELSRCVAEAQASADVLNEVHMLGRISAIAEEPTDDEDKPE